MWKVVRTQKYIKSRYSPWETSQVESHNIFKPLVVYLWWCLGYIFMEYEIKELKIFKVPSGKVLYFRNRRNY